MKKDKQWLKEEAEKQAIVKEFSGGWTYIKRIDFEKLFELIDQLEELEITEKQAWEKISGNKGIGADYHKDFYDSLIKLWKKEDLSLVEFKHELMSRFFENKPEKSVIPSYVADFVKEKQKEGLKWFDALGEAADAVDSGMADEVEYDIYNWISVHPDEFVISYRDGYEVEKQPLYTTCFTTEKSWMAIYLYREKNGELEYGDNMRLFNKNEAKYQLTEQEIKDFDERFWEFAEEVTE